jgi:hypothetical protein
MDNNTGLLQILLDSSIYKGQRVIHLNGLYRHNNRLTIKEQLENCPSKITGKFKVVLKTHIYTDKVG